MNCDSIHWRFPRRRKAARNRKGARPQRPKGDIIVNLIAGIIVAAFGLFLIGLAAACVFRRQVAEKFLSGFARSAKAHFTEQGLRLGVGFALIYFSSSMWFPTVFTVFGWILIISSAVLLVTPWKWHRKYAKSAVPLALKRLWLFAFGSLALGIFVLYGLSRAIS